MRSPAWLALFIRENASEKNRRRGRNTQAGWHEAADSRRVWGRGAAHKERRGRERRRGCAVGKGCTFRRGKHHIHHGSGGRVNRRSKLCRRRISRNRRMRGRGHSCGDCRRHGPCGCSHNRRRRHARLARDFPEAWPRTESPPRALLRIVAIKVQGTRPPAMAMCRAARTVVVATHARTTRPVPGPRVSPAPRPCSVVAVFPTRESGRWPDRTFFLFFWAKNAPSRAERIARGSGAPACWRR